MAVAFNVDHKCMVPAGSVPMIVRVVEALITCEHIGNITISTDAISLTQQALGSFDGLQFAQSTESAPASIISALNNQNTRWPVLVTTADHALLTPAMVEYFLTRSAASGADLTAGLASRETIMAGLPETRRTYLKFADLHVSGCNLFALNRPVSLNIVHFWKQADKNRKKPWKLIGAFGLAPFLTWMAGRLTLDRAFEIGSQRLGAMARPVLMPFAEAAVDVDKPEDKELVDKLLQKRGV